MRAAILTLLLAGCAAPPPPVQSVAAPEPLACPPLPTLPRGAGRKAMLAHIDKTAALYADCATRER
jgi:hypothetical protein